jgi:glycine hydroxymethyltransferase
MRRIREAQGSSIRSRSAGGRVVALQLSQSYILREQPLRELAVCIRNEFPDIKLAVDISHPMVLHMGDRLAQPIACGFDIIHGNTHKTFPGPQKAIVAFSSELELKTVRRITEHVCPILQSNCGTAEILALGVAALEMRRHAREYARNIVENAQALGAALAEHGFRIVGETFGFTETHQVWLLGAGEIALKDNYRRLVACGLRANPAVLPFTGKRWGLRMGTQGLTRRGMEPSDMRDIARLMKRALLDRDDPERIRADAYALMGRYPLSDLRFRLTPAEEQLLGRFATCNEMQTSEV